MPTTVEPELVFGRLIGAHQVDDAIIELLQKWIETYLWEVARQSNEEFARLTGPRSWRVASEMERMPEDQTPGVIIVCNGIAERPERVGASKGVYPGRSGFPYSGTWEYEIGCLVSAKGKKEVAAPRALRRAKMYLLAIRAAMIQQKDDDDLLGMIDWVGEEYGGLDSNADRTICLPYGRFYVTAHDVTSWGTGPLAPSDPPPDPQSSLWPQVSDVDVQITKEPIE